MKGEKWALPFICCAQGTLRGTDKLPICVFYALKIVRYSFFSQKLAYKYANSVFTHSCVLKYKRIDLFMFTFSVRLFRTFCKFPPKPLPLTAYQECKPVQSSALQVRKQHPYLPPHYIFGVVLLLSVHNKWYHVGPIKLQMI